MPQVSEQSQGLADDHEIRTVNRTSANYLAVRFPLWIFRSRESLPFGQRCEGWPCIKTKDPKWGSNRETPCLPFHINKCTLLMGMLVLFHVATTRKGRSRVAFFLSSEAAFCVNACWASSISHVAQFLNEECALAPFSPG